MPEPELMDDAEQARAYGQADFTEPHNQFINLCRAAFSDAPVQGDVLDLGCGTADITIRFARVFPETIVTGVDGATAMLQFAREAICAAGLERRIKLLHRHLPAHPPQRFHLVICNSLLHHLADPAVLWSTVAQWAEPGARVFVMDLMRPASRLAAQALVAHYAGNEPTILQRDFFNSLLAAYTVAEVETQLVEAGLAHLRPRVVSDRHWVVNGILP